MKLVVSFYGMCLCVLEGRKGTRARAATVLLLNGAAPSTSAAGGGTRLPFHHPLLFVPVRNAEPKKSSWSPVPAADSLVDTEHLVAGAAHAWNLSGLEVTLGTGRGIVMYENQEADTSGRLRDPGHAAGDETWLDWRRIPDLSRIAPGARLRATHKKIGMHVLGRVRFTGGELRGATPKNPAGVATPWYFSDGFSQVITDRFEFHCELPGTALEGHGYAGSRGQTIRLRGGGRKPIRLSVVHEATPSAATLRGPLSRKAAKAAATQLPHYAAFYRAIEGPTVEVLAALPPRLGKPMATVTRPVIDTPTCPPALI